MYITYTNTYTYTCTHKQTCAHTYTKHTHIQIRVHIQNTYAYAYSIPCGVCLRFIFFLCICLTTVDLKYVRNFFDSKQNNYAHAKHIFFRDQSFTCITIILVNPRATRVEFPIACSKLVAIASVVFEYNCI